MLIQERLQLILKMHNMTPSGFADKLGIQRSNVSHVLSGRNKPSLDFLEKIIVNFPRVNAHWLLTGKMNATNPADEASAKSPDKIPYSDSKRTESKSGELEKIVEFYTDGTFRAYLPTEK